jgi:hemerythrin-like domain-containing protein
MAQCHHHHRHAEHATDVLVEEHEVILRIIAVLNAAAEKLAAGQEVSPDVFRQAVDFIRTFADQCHHGKEQDLLFPALEQRGVPRDGGPIGVMLYEHDLGRAFVKQMANGTEAWAAGDTEAKSEVIEGARGYAQLLAQHIHKENMVLYPMGNRVLSEADQQELLEKFEEVEEAMGEGTHERYVALVEELEAQFGL